MHGSRIIATALLPLLTLSASAQSVSSLNDNYSRLDVMPMLSQEHYSAHGSHASSHHSLFGLGIAYVTGTNIMKDHSPLFLESGLEVSYVSRSEEIDYWNETEMYDQDEVSTRMLSAIIPFDVVYKIRLNDEAALVPSVGMDAKINMLAANYYDGDKRSAFDDGARRFQWGWNFGLGVEFSRYSLGYRRYADITSFQKVGDVKTTYRNHYIAFCIRF